LRLVREEVWELLVVVVFEIPQASSNNVRDSRYDWKAVFFQHLRILKPPPLIKIQKVHQAQNIYVDIYTAGKYEMMRYLPVSNTSQPERFREIHPPIHPIRDQ
jgi:hypothetical protein